MSILFVSYIAMGCHGKGNSLFYIIVELYEIIAFEFFFFFKIKKGLYLALGGQIFKNFARRWVL